MDPVQLRHIIEQYANGNISPEELKLFQQLLSAKDKNESETVTEAIQNWLEEQAAKDPAYQSANYQPILERVLAIDKPVSSETTTKALKKKSVFQRYYLHFAAAAILVAITTTLFFLIVNNKNTRSTKDPLVTSPSELILPGSERATLTLADGTTLSLDSLAGGLIASQGNTSVIKEGDEILYKTSTSGSSELLMNTMTTPNGGQYKLRLPDGTIAWLNAASSITYPTAFTRDDRKVKVRGEVFFEVAPNKQKPFLVEVDGKITVKALGTVFNINSYADEGKIRTTLVEGSVQVSDGLLQETLPKNYESVILYPGQQAVKPIPSASQAGGGDLKLQKNTLSGTQLAQVLAWKNGYFNFENMNIRQAAKQIERWYNVRFEFIGNFSNVELKGKMDRGVMLADITRFFNEYGFKTEIKGRLIIVKD